MTTSAFVPPLDYSRLRVVGSFEELISTPMVNGVNALCWPRVLRGDFQEIADLLGTEEGITPVEDEVLAELKLSAAGQEARATLVEDLRRLREHDLQPSLDTIRGDLRDLSGGPVPTDVYSWHADSATVPADTYLCSYVEPTSELLRNEEAILRVHVPETRAALLAEYGGEDDAGFREFLNERFYDLHYVPLPGARPIVFGVGNLWRVATDYPGNPVPPCIHRAPAMAPGRAPRLLLIS